MKLSYRDKVIFICVIVVVILVAGFFVFIKPAAEDADIAKENLEAKQTEWEETEAKINTLKDLVDQLKATADGIDELQEMFLEENDPYINEQIIYAILAEADVDVISMETQYIVAESAEAYAVYPKHVVAYDFKITSDLYNELPQEVYDLYNSVQQAAPDSMVLGVTDVSIGYNIMPRPEDFQKILDFCDLIAENDKTISIVNIVTPEYYQDGDITDTQGLITLRMYSIYHVNTDKIREEKDEVDIAEFQAQQAETAETAVE